MSSPILVTREDAQKSPEYLRYNLDSLWLEITSLCNQSCKHCYSSSSQLSKEKKVTKETWFRIISEASKAGCKRLQFIGGEPTIVAELADYISYARKQGFEEIRVSTNGVSLPQSLLESFVNNKVVVSVSFYSMNSDIHDEITNHKGSKVRTLNNIDRLISSGVNTQVCMVIIDQDADDVVITKSFLESLGVNVFTDRVRPVGRASHCNQDNNSSLDYLCGNCWKGKLCIMYDGNVVPCIMSRELIIGSILDRDLRSILESEEIRQYRKLIYDNVWQVRNSSHNIQELSSNNLGVTSCLPDHGYPCLPDTGYPCLPGTGYPCLPDTGYPCLPDTGNPGDPGGPAHPEEPDN